MFHIVPEIIGLIQLPTFVPIYTNRLDCKEHIIMITESKIHIWTSCYIAVMTEEILLTDALVGIVLVVGKMDFQISIYKFLFYISHFIIYLYGMTQRYLMH